MDGTVLGRRVIRARWEVPAAAAGHDSRFVFPRNSVHVVQPLWSHAEVAPQSVRLSVTREIYGVCNRSVGDARICAGCSRVQVPAFAAAKMAARVGSGSKSLFGGKLNSMRSEKKPPESI
jgi:hypothetical protein